MKTKFLICLVHLALFAGAHAASVGSAFTYQGRLTDAGAPVSGEKDFQFLLFDAAAGGDPVSLTLTNENVWVTNGLFTTVLDFGTNAFSGKAVWLEIAVRPGADTGAFTALEPRQAVTPTPFALVALNLASTLTSDYFAGAYGQAVSISNAANVFAGTFRGNGGSLTNLNAAALGGQVAAASLSNAWRIGGNTGTTPANHFLGTTDNQPLELRVNNARVLRLLPDTTPQNAPSVLGGSPVNLIAPGVVGATIAGGGSANYEGNGPAPNTVGLSYGTVGGGVGNDTAGVGATIGGGYNNTAIGFFATVAGGGVNLANGDHAFVGGGLFNQATNTGSTVAGGRNNAARGRYSSVGGGTNGLVTGSHGTIAGGADNLVQGQYSVIGGGHGNTNELASDHAFIGGGYRNHIATFTDGGAIAGGYHNRLGGALLFGGAPFSSIGGGRGNASTATSSTIGGGQSNTIAGDFATISGGTLNHASGLASTVGGGTNNLATELYSTVAGGRGNSSSNDASTVGGGYGNTSSGGYATVSGGFENTGSGNNAAVSGGIHNEASGHASTVGGGGSNDAEGQFSMVPGGSANAANGSHSFAAGRRAQAEHEGAFVWADHARVEENFSSTAPHQFLIRAEGGVGIGHNAPDAPLHVVGGSDAGLAGGGILVLGAVNAGNVAFDNNEIQARNNAAASTLFLNAGGGNVSIGTVSSTARLRVVNATCDGTTWNNASDRNLKAGFEPVDARAVLEQVAALPLTRWHYTNAPGSRHVGPMAQDFHAAFGLGTDDKTIPTVDADGVALAAIQGLHALVKEQAAELKALREELLELRRGGMSHKEHKETQRGGTK